jgi:hypothetical protein
MAAMRALYAPMRFNLFLSIPLPSFKIDSDMLFLSTGSTRVFHHESTRQE